MAKLLKPDERGVSTVIPKCFRSASDWIKTGLVVFTRKNESKEITVITAPVGKEPLMDESSRGRGESIPYGRWRELLRSIMGRVMIIIMITEGKSSR